MIQKFLVPFALAVSLVAASTPEASQSAVGKFDRIARAGLKSGETVTLTADELNSFLKYDGAGGIPAGVENVSVQLRTGGGSLSAVVDLEKAGEARQDAPLFVKLLMRGTRTVTADIDFAVDSGYATTKIVAVAIDDFTLSGTALQWFLESFAPESVQLYISGEPVLLEGNVNKVRVEPGRAIFIADE